MTARSFRMSTRRLNSPRVTSFLSRGDAGSRRVVWIRRNDFRALATHSADLLLERTTEEQMVWQEDTRVKRAEPHTRETFASTI